MIRQQFRLRRAAKAVVECVQHGCDTLVADLTPALEQTRVSHISSESVDEGVNGIRRRTTANCETRGKQFAQSSLKLRLGQQSCGHKHRMGKFVPDDRADLCDLSRRRQRSSRAISDACSVLGTASDSAVQL
jgi:hypothetical protein